MYVEDNNGIFSWLSVVCSLWWFRFFLIREREKKANYDTFIGEVVSVETIRGRNTAIVESGIPEIGKFHIKFQDPGDYTEGTNIDCIWDGKNAETAEQDLRSNQRIGIYICFTFVALMVVIMLAILFFF